MTSDPKLRALVVEDEPIVAMLIEEMLEDLGYECCMASSLPEGLLAASTTKFSVSILDVNLHGLESFPIAEILLKDGQKFIFATGYGRSICHARFPLVPVITKPYVFSDLTSALRQVTV